MKLILKNHTEWQTKDLRKLIIANLKESGLINQFKSRTVILSNQTKRRFNFQGSNAMLGMGWIQMCIPKQFFVKAVGIDGTLQSREVEFDSVGFSKVFQHELQHNQGLRHKDMLDWQKFDCSWANQFQVRKYQSQSFDKPIVSLKQKRLLAAESKVAKLEKLINAKQILLKKWQKKLTYYNRG